MYPVIRSLISVKMRDATKHLHFTLLKYISNLQKIGAKLEATDMCEPYLICPATIVGHHGRLLRIEYDGWGNSYDQLFDYRYSLLFKD